jgi:metal-dependent amidase/aminoacylase/carboxypeptidase family protein
VTTTADQLLAGYEAGLTAELPAAVELRRRIHAEPDLGGAEARTSALVATELGCADAPAVAEGRLIRVETGDGPAVALRAELDALPIAEDTGLPWAARNGAMHACGHDVHLAALTAVVRTVRRAGGPRPLLAVLQPREESTPSGARDVLASPELAAQDAGAFIGAHVQPTMPAGVVAVQPGPVNAAADDFTVVIRGRPGHGAYPHLTADPVVAAAAVVTTLQHVVARRIDPMHPAVLTVASINAGTTMNAIPAEAVLLGEPVLRNDPGLAANIAPRLTALGFDPAGDHRSCGADDFAYYCEAFPSLMCFVGVDSPPGVGLHHPAFAPPDRAVGDVARVLLAGYLAACQYLAGGPA